MRNCVVKLAYVAVVCMMGSSMALAANGHSYKVTMDCPDIGTKGNEVLTNYSTYIAGQGIERVNSDMPTHPLFEGPLVPGANVPVDLVSSGYLNSGVSYNPANGAVTCYYLSAFGFDPFSVSYLMTNALNGDTTSSSAEEIHIKLPIALKN